MSIMRRRNTISPLTIVVVIAIIAIIVVVAIIIMNKNNNKPTNHEVIDVNPSTSGETIVDVETQTSKKLAYSEYEGYWTDISRGGVDGGGIDLWFYCNDDDTINFSISEYRQYSFDIEKLTIDKSKSTYFKDTSGSYEGTIVLKDSVIEVNYNVSSETKSATFSKESTSVITRRQLFEEIQNIINSGYSKVDASMFSYQESDYYMSLKLIPTCYLKPSEQNVSYEGSEYIRDIYVIDKEKGKLVSLPDLLDNNYNTIGNVDDYIKKYIEIKKLEYNRLCELQGNSGDSWPYADYKSILDAYNYNSKYFYLDEAKQNVYIKALAYPDEARKALGDIWVAVPFEICFNEEKCTKMGVVTKKFNPEIPKDISIAYLKFIINNQSGDNMEDFGDSDTNSYNLIYFEKPELAIVDSNYDYKKYSYDENMNVVESDDYNSEYTSIREKKYSPLEIKQVFCLSSDL